MVDTQLPSLAPVNKPASINKLDARIIALSDLAREELVEGWIKLYKHPPPKSVKRSLLERAIAYRYQSRKLGKLRPETSRKLLTIAVNSGDADGIVDIKSATTANGKRIITKFATFMNNNETDIISSKPATNLKPGTRLVREWHGKSYQVRVTDTGIIWNDQEYRSLSAIAKSITGAKWSGPRFFGL